MGSHLKLNKEEQNFLIKNYKVLKKNRTLTRDLERLFNSQFPSKKATYRQLCYIYNQLTRNNSQIDKSSSNSFEYKEQLKRKNDLNTSIEIGKKYKKNKNKCSISKKIADKRYYEKNRQKILKKKNLKYRPQIIKNAINRINKLKNPRSKQKLSKKDEVKIKRLNIKISKLGVPFFKNKRNINSINRNQILNVNFNIDRIKLKLTKIKINGLKKRVMDYTPRYTYVKYRLLRNDFIYNKPNQKFCYPNNIFKAYMSSTNQLQKLIRSKYIISLIDHVYAFRDTLIKQIYIKIINFNNKYVKYLEINQLNSSGKEEFLRNHYGGQQFHLKSNETKNYKCSDFVYYDINNNLEKLDIKCFSQPITKQTHSEYDNLIETFSQTNLNENKERKTLARKCDYNCKIPEYWATNLYNNFKTIEPVYDLKFMQNNLFNLEYCFICSKQNQTKCTDIENCTDTINILNYLSIHYQHLRTITRKLYRIRQLNLLLFDINAALIDGNLIELNNISNFNDNFAGTNIFINTKSEILYDHELYEKLKKNFQNELRKKITLYKCIICNRMLSMDKLTSLCDNEMQNEIFLRSVITPVDINANKTYICRDQCYNQIYIQEKTPIYSHLNNMRLIQPPEEIAKLNLFEKLLIQKAKCFQTIIKLQPYTKFNGQDYVSALKGLAVHLPLSLDLTNQYIIDTLPNFNSLDVIINSIPTKASNIWRALVNLESVYTALKWLKENNHLYRNIQIDFDLSRNRTSILFNDSQSDGNGFIDKPELPYLTQLKSQNIKQFSVIDLNKINENNTDINKYACKRIQAVPINDKHINLDHLCFLDIYPTGIGGIYDEREFKVNPAMYIKWLLSQSNPLPRRNIQFLFSAINNKDIRSIDSGIYASVRTSKMPNLNAKKLKNYISENNRQLEANLSTTLAAVRGSKEFWSLRFSDLDAFNENFGPATFFFTLSCNEYHWEDLHKFLIERNNDLDNVDELNINKLCSIDPVTVSFYFEKKIRAFFSKVFLDKNGPLGEIDHYFRRIEYQARGAPHVHGKLWNKNAPIYGKDPDNDVIEFIDKYITCRIPDPDTEPDLYDLVMRYQVHKCSKSCRRLVSSSNNKKSMICRYGFPRPVSNKTTLNTIEKVIKSRQRGKNSIKIYNLKRSYEERYINDYNPIVLLLWRGNIDIQYIGHTNMVIDKYITAYITKAEKNATEEIWDSCSTNSNLYSALKSFALKSFKQREIGAYEAADKLLGHSLYEFSDQIKWLNALPYNERKRRVKEIKEIENLNDDDENIYHNNLIDNYYPNRPDELNEISLFDFDSYYDVKKTKCNVDHIECYALKDNLGYIHKRNKPKVIKTPRIKAIDHESAEKYFHQILILFKPWRNELSDLKQNFATYQEAFENAYANKTIDNIAVSEFQLQKKKIQDALEIMQDLKKETLIEINENISQSNSFESTQIDDEPDLGVNDFKPRLIDQEVLNKNINNLNIEQKKIYDDIISRINHQESHKEKTCHCTHSLEPIRIFCSGVAGTGKSYLIDTITAQLSTQFSNQNNDWTVAVLAPTGLAAYNIKGMTIHRFFKLPIFNNNDEKHWALNDQSLKIIRQYISNIKLFIIDEISMVSNVRLAQIHLRLNEIFCSKEDDILFGGKNIILFGDLFQLRPVKSQFCFETINKKQKKNIFGALPIEYNFWDYFEYTELTINMRQKDDPIYSEILNKIRIGISSKEDIDLLKQRIFINQDSKLSKLEQAVEKFVELYKNNPKLMCLFSTNELTNNFNQLVSNYLKLTIHKIEAIDSNKNNNFNYKKLNNHKKRLIKSKKKISQTAGLETVLQIGVGSRVMLKKNIDVSEGLCNGALGIVTNIGFNMNNSVDYITVRLDSTNEEVDIERVLADYEYHRNYYISRRQFPLSNAWALTIHKSQGITLEQAMIDLGTTFENGMGYVALSRVKKLENVFLIDFEPKSLCCELKCINEYNRLREKFLAIKPIQIFNSINDYCKNLPRIPVVRELLSNFEKLQLNLKLNQYSSQKKENTKHEEDKKENKNEKKKKNKTEKNAQAHNILAPVPINDNYFLKLNNFNNACFANVILQALIAYGASFYQIILESLNDPLSLEFYDVFQIYYQHHLNRINTSIDAHNLRYYASLSANNLGDNFLDGTQQDAFSFYSAIFDRWPEVLREKFIFQKAKTRTCECGASQVDTENISTFINLARTQETTIKFYDMFHNLIEAYCPNCKRETVQNQYTRCIFNRNHKYLIIRLQNTNITYQLNQRTGNRNEIITELNSDITEYDENRIILNANIPSEFKIVSAVVYLRGEKTNSFGHYVIWVRKINNNGWLRVSDTVSRSYNKLINKLKNVYILFLERN